MATYSKSLSSDFSGNLNITQLKNEINENGLIVPQCRNILNVGDAVDIFFQAPLSVTEQTDLDTIIANHVPDMSPQKNAFYTYIPRNNSISSTTYQKIGGPFKYGGSKIIGKINYIEVISNKDENVASYSVRIYDRTNNLVIAEKNGLSNETEEINDLGTITNVPASNAILEIQAKRVGGTENSKSVYVDEVIVYHDN